MKYADLHLHSMDLYDSDNAPERVCARMKELGATGFVLTQHGVLSGIEPMKECCEKYGLKFVPGIETYFGEDTDIKKNQHLILISVNYAGYKAIWKAVSDSQNQEGFSVMNEEILRKYFGEGSEGYGNVIATTACISGPVAAVLQSNDLYDKAIEKLQTFYNPLPYVSGKELEEAKKNEVEKIDLSIFSRVDSLKQTIQDLEDELRKETDEKNAYKRLASTKFGKRIKYVEKLKTSEDPAYEIAKAALDKEMEDAEAANAEIPNCEAKIAKIKKQIKTYKAEYKSVQEKAERLSARMNKIKEYEAKKLPPDKLYEKAKAEMAMLDEIFGHGNFYAEIQYHGIPTEREIYPKIVEMARALSIPIVATNDVHMVYNDQDEMLKRRILRSLRFGEWSPDQTGDDQLYIKTDEELTEWLLKLFDEKTVEEAMGNIKTVFDRCNVVFESGSHYPKYQTKNGMSANRALLEEIRKGAEWRFPEGLDQAHKDRINREYTVIKDMGFADYHRATCSATG